MADGASPASTPLVLPLARYKGKKPPAPDWFEAAIAAPYETRWVEVDGANIRYQVWGDAEKPGLLLVHGNGAHAHWYDFIAPYFAETHYVVAMSFGGMGDSDHRDTYSVAQFTREQLAVCEDSGLFAEGRKPCIIAHSFGGFITMNTGMHYGDRFNGIMIVDSPVRPPDDEWNGPPDRSKPNRIYADFEGALGRFRLAPPQPCENDYIVDYIGRHSLKEVDAGKGQTGWSWKFDASIFRHFKGDLDAFEMFKGITGRLSVLRGEQSVLVTDRVWDYMQSLRGDMTMISLPNAQHHVMLDQPLAFVAALRTQLAAWDH
ncbi:MAG: alpha/beta hydrolase [Pseudomonadota bacterium]